MVDEEPDVTLDALQPGCGKVRHPDGRPRHGLGVDGVGLAPRTGGPAGSGHELGWHPHDGLARQEQVTLQASRDVAAVLQGEGSLRVTGARPLDQALVAPVAGGDAQLTEDLPRDAMQGHRGVGVLVAVHSHYDHSWSPFPRHQPAGSRDRRRTRLSGAEASSYEVTPASLRRRRAAERMKVIPLAG